MIYFAKTGENFQKSMKICRSVHVLDSGDGGGGGGEDSGSGDGDERGGHAKG